MANQTTIAAALQDKIDAKAAIKAAIESKGVTVGTVKLSDYAAKVGEIQTTGDWIRPSDWLEIDSLVTAGEQKTVGLYAIYPNNNELGMTNTVAFTVTGAHTINWGDGNIENVNSNVQAQHIYDYDLISASTYCVRGYRQVRITITPQSGANITNLQFWKRHTSVVFGKITSQWLDINISGTHLTKLNFTGNNVFANLLEKVKIYQTTNSFTDCYGLFSSLYTIQKIEINLNMSSVTTTAYMFATCYSLRILDLSNLTIPNNCNITNMFNDTYLNKIVMWSNVLTPNSTSFGVFRAMYNIQKLDLSKLNMSTITNGREWFAYMWSLQELDLSHTTLINMTTISAGAFLHSYNLKKCRLPNIRISFSVINNPLSASELNLLFGDLYDLTGQTAQTITITGCTGAATCNRAIATSKNWIVTG